MGQNRKEMNEVIAIENVEVVETEHELVIKMEKPYVFEDKAYVELDLRGLEDIKGRDLIAIQREIDKAGGFSIIPEMSTHFATLAAARVTGLPIEFFEGLNAKIVLTIKNRVTGFLYGKE
jgi:hypothetical protein